MSWYCSHSSLTLASIFFATFSAQRVRILTVVRQVVWLKALTAARKGKPTDAEKQKSVVAMSDFELMAVVFPLPPVPPKPPFDHSHFLPGGRGRLWEGAASEEA